MRKKSWSEQQLIEAVKTSFSLRQVIAKLGLVEAGGNYEQVRHYISEYKIDSSHFKGRGWSKETKKSFVPRLPLELVLVKNSTYQSFKLKSRLFRDGLKSQYCELCRWAERSKDGRLPLELDHINGDRHDNRLENLRILCPNCHSLQETHRGRNKAKRRLNAGVV